MPRYPSPQVLRRAKLTEMAMRLAVLGLTADAERFTLDAVVTRVTCRDQRALSQRCSVRPCPRVCWLVKRGQMRAIAPLAPDRGLGTLLLGKDGYSQA